MKKKIVVLAILILLIIGALTFYATHRSVDQELTEDDLRLKEILETEDNSVTTTEVVETQPVQEVEVTPEEPEEIPQEPETIEEETTEDDVQVLKQGEFDPEAQDSDSLHRGWGSLQVVSFEGENKIIFNEDFKVTNGPDYRLYLVKEQNVETEARFDEIKADSYNIAEIKQFDGFQTFDIPNDVNLDDVEGVVIWCERFGVFISYANLN